MGSLALPSSLVARLAPSRPARGVPGPWSWAGASRASKAPRIQALWDLSSRLPAASGRCNLAATVWARVRRPVVPDQTIFTSSGNIFKDKSFSSIIPFLLRGSPLEAGPFWLTGGPCRGRRRFRYRGSRSGKSRRTLLARRAARTVRGRENPSTGRTGLAPTTLNSCPPAS